MSESHGHFAMDGRTSARSRTLDSASVVPNGLGEDDEEEDTRNFVSTLDVDAIKGKTPRTTPGRLRQSIIALPAEIYFLYQQNTILHQP